MDWAAQITAKLDQRIQEAESLCTRLDELSQVNTDKLAARHSSSAGPRPQGADQKKALLLAREGLDACEISKSLKRPVGEVELILHLQKIAS